MSLHQNAWQLSGFWLNRQIRRSEVVRKCISKDTTVLDIGCAEAFTTKYIIEKAKTVVGIELNFDNLRIAKEKVYEGHFINGSIDFLPFKDNSFNAITILEVLEHLPKDLQLRGMDETNRVLSHGGNLILSVPFKEKIQYTKCIHCNQETPLWGHLHSFDEKKISSLLPDGLFSLVESFELPHIVYISCLSVFKFLPVQAWLKLNDLLGKMKFLRGYWIILNYKKSAKLR